MQPLVVAVGDDEHGDDFIAFALEARAGDAAGGAAHGADVGFVEANRQAALGAEDDVILAAGDLDADQRIAFFQADGDDAVLADVAVGAQGRLLHRALGGGEHEELLVLAEILDRQHIGDLFACLESSRFAIARPWLVRLISGTS